MTSSDITQQIGPQKGFGTRSADYIFRRTNFGRTPPCDSKIHRAVRVDALSTSVVCAPTSSILKDILAEKWQLKKDDNYVFVLPPTLLIAGKSFAALEFLVYFNAYVQNNVANGKPLQVVCTKNQAINMKKFLERTIMGPDWDDPSVYDFVPAQDREFLNNTKKFYAPKRPDGTIRPLSEFIEFSVFDPNGKAYVEISERGTLLIEQAKHKENGPVSGYNINHQRYNADLNEVITSSSASLLVQYNVPQMPLIDIPDELIKKAQHSRYGFAVTCFGSSTGFDKDDYTTSFVVWCKGPGILIDPSSEALKATELMGFTDRDIPHVLLTHCHEDHDSGIIEKILQGKKINLLCSKVVYEELMIKIEAILKCQDIESSIDPRRLVNWTELVVGQKNKVELGNGKSAIIKAWWNFHTIPTNGIEISLDGKSVYHSSDTQFGLDFFDARINDGTMTADRRQKFIDDLVDQSGKPKHELTYFEMGGPPIHTNYSEINGIISPEYHDKVLGYHAPEAMLSGSNIRRAKLYDTEIITSPTHQSIQRYDRTILVDSAFGLNAGHVDALLAHHSSKIIEVKAGTVLLRPSDPVRKSMYISLSGVAEIYDQDFMIGCSGAGTALGDWGYFTGLPPSATVIAATDMRLIECCPKNILQPEEVMTLRDVAHFDRNYALLFSRFFRGLGLSLNDLPHLTSAIKTSHKLLQIPAGGQIVIQGEPAYDLYFITQGDVKISYDDGDTLRNLLTRYKGDLFGEKALVPGTKRTASVSAGDNGATLLAINGQEFRAILESMPGMLNAFDLYLQVKMRPLPISAPLL